MSEDKKYMVEHPYEPYLVKAPCWIRNGGKTEILYDYVPASFARHPCDLFDKNGEREVWKSLTEYTADNCKNMLPKASPEKEGYLRDNIVGGLEVSSFGRIGIPIKREDCNGCKGCTLRTECDKRTFHYILPQYEKCSWNDSQQEFENYNGWLVVNIKEKKEDGEEKEEEKHVYDLFAKAFLGKIEGDGKETHHKDNNGHHNTLDNLELLTKSEHFERHHQGRGCEMCREASEKED